MVNVVFQVPKGGLLYKAFDMTGATDIRYMVSLRDADIESLTYDWSDTKKDIPLTRGDKNPLSIFQNISFTATL